MKILEKGIAGPCITLCKENGDTFRVIGFTDSHYDDWVERGNCTIKAMKQAIQKEQPDLVLFLGDTVTGGDNRNRLEFFCNLMDELGIYWCPVLGNHEGDNPLSVTREFMMRRMARSRYCLMDASEKHLADGSKVGRPGDYGVHLADKDGNIFETLFFMNTGTDMSIEEKEKNNYPRDRTVYEYLLPEQIRWYKEVLAAQGEGIPSVMYGHIALCEYVSGYELATLNDTCYETGRETEPGCCWKYGYRRERICCSDYNSGMFDALLEGGSTKAFFCGHDHINDFVIKYKGIILGYNQPGGYSSYNIISKAQQITAGTKDKLIQGYTVYTFKKGDELQVEPVYYHDIFPEMREEVWNTIRK